MSRRILFGNWPAGIGSGAGLRVSKPGRDAASGNPADLVFDSDWADVLPVHQIGSFQLGGGSPASATITYPDLGYVPFAEFAFYPGATTPGDVPTFLPHWQPYEGQVFLFPSSGSSGLKLSAYRDHIAASMIVYAPNGNAEGFPLSFQIAYAVYRQRADV